MKKEAEVSRSAKMHDETKGSWRYRCMRAVRLKLPRGSRYLQLSSSRGKEEGKRARADLPEQRTTSPSLGAADDRASLCWQWEPPRKRELHTDESDEALPDRGIS